MNCQRLLLAPDKNVDTCYLNAGKACEEFLCPQSLYENAKNLEVGLIGEKTTHKSCNATQRVHALPLAPFQVTFHGCCHSVELSINRTDIGTCTLKLRFDRVGAFNLVDYSVLELHGRTLDSLYFRIEIGGVRGRTHPRV